MKTKRSVPALVDVARRAGVGAATVSRVINGGENVSNRTLAAVLKAIEELGYHPNQAARSLKGARTKTIGLIVPSVADPFFSVAAEAIQVVVRQHGSLVLLAASGNLPEREREEATTLIQRRIDGLILAPSQGADVTMLKHAGFPVVCFDRPFTGHPAPAVLSDNYGGAKAAVEHLVEGGARRILCLAGNRELYTSQRRVRGYQEVVRAAGLPYLAELEINDHAAADAALRKHLQATKLIDAIFSIKNSITVDAYKLLRQMRIKVPSAVKLIGFDDFELADALEPAITVVRQPVVALATRAAEMLFEAMEEGKAVHGTVTLKVELVHRGSCCPSSMKRVTASRKNRMPSFSGLRVVESG